jgi:hypothetical protein
MMRSIAVRGVLAALLAWPWFPPLGTAAEKPPAVKLMFGKPTKDLAGARFMDFAYVTPEAKLDQGQDWGWTASRKITAWAYANDRRGTIPPDRLLDHSVTCWDGTLSIRTRSGRAAVHVWVGDAIEGIARTRASYRIQAGAKTVVEERVTFKTLCTERWWLRGESEVYRRSTDPWTRQVRPILDEYDFTVDVRHGRLDLKMENVNLSAIVVLSGANRTKMRELLAGVERERRRQFAERYPWQPRPDEPLPPIDSAAGRRGLVVFQKWIDDEVYPWSRPKAGEISDVIRVFAAQGEQEAFRFGVLPLRDLQRFSVEVGDFAGPGGAKIGTAACADLWTERYTERGSESTTGRNCSLDPVCDVLLRRGPTDYEPGLPRMFILDLRVPKDAAPGEYRAAVTFREQGREAGHAELLLRVLPWQIPSPPIPYNFQANYYSWADLLPEEQDPAAMHRAMEARVRFIGKYGFSASYFTPREGWATITGKPGDRHLAQNARQAAEMDWWYQLVMNEGNARQWIMFHWVGMWSMFHWTPPLEFKWDGTGTISPADRQDLVRCVREYEELCRRKGYPKHYWYGSGEPDNFGRKGVERGNEYAQIAREAGAATLCTLNGPIGAQLAPAVHDMVLANHATPISDEFIRQVHGLGHQFGSHNTGSSRIHAGYQIWRMGAAAKFQEGILYVAYTVPYAYLPWNYKAASVYPASDLGWRPTTRWLRYRDGRDDYLYLHALQQRLQRAEAAGLSDSPAAKEAQAFLIALHDKIYVDPLRYFEGTIDAKEVGSSVAVGWSGRRFARYRWLMASLVMQLDASLAAGVRKIGQPGGSPAP